MFIVPPQMQISCERSSPPDGQDVVSGSGCNEERIVSDSKKGYKNLCLGGGKVKYRTSDDAAMEEIYSQEA
jgi:hypothetical protein